MSTLKYDSASEGDSISEGDSDYKDVFDSKDESNPGGEFEGHRDSDRGSDSEGGLASKGGTSEGIAPEGGPASEDGTSESRASEDSSTLESLQRPLRVRQIPMRLANFELLQDTEIYSKGEVIQSAVMVDFEPVNINEALKKNVWVNSMKEELEPIERSKTRELIVLPQNKKTISVRQVLKIKLKPDGSFAKHKSRLVVRGFLQKFGLDYFEVFSPVARHETKRLVVSIAVNKNWPMIHLDVKSKFLNGLL